MAACASNQRIPTRLKERKREKENAAWQTPSPIGLLDRLSTLRSPWVAPPSTRARARDAVISRRSPRVPRARQAQRSKLTIINEKRSRFVSLILCHRTRVLQRTIVAERCGFVRKIEWNLRTIFYELKLCDFVNYIFSYHSDHSKKSCNTLTVPFPPCVNIKLSIDLKIHRT